MPATGTENKLSPTGEEVVQYPVSYQVSLILDYYISFAVLLLHTIIVGL